MTFLAESHIEEKVMLKLTDLSKAYRTDEVETVALNNVNIEIESGDFVAIMGRAAAHLNTNVTWDDLFGSQFQFCDYVDELTPESPAPVHDDENGRYPVPIPGQWKEF